MIERWEKGGRWWWQGFGERTEARIFSRCGWVDRWPGPVGKRSTLVSVTAGPVSANRSNGCQKDRNWLSRRTEMPSQTALSDASL
jgi:hypothetical protein